MYKIIAPRAAVGALRSSIMTRRAFDCFGFGFGDFFGRRLRNVSLAMRADHGARLYIFLAERALLVSLSLLFLCNRFHVFRYYEGVNKGDYEEAGPVYPPQEKVSPFRTGDKGRDYADNAGNDYVLHVITFLSYTISLCFMTANPRILKSEQFDSLN